MENPPPPPEDTQPALDTPAVRSKRTRARKNPAAPSLTQQEDVPVATESTVVTEVVSAIPQTAVAVAEPDPTIAEPPLVEVHDAPRPRLRFVSITFLAGFGMGAFIGVALALLALVVASSRAAEDDLPNAAVGPTSTVAAGAVAPSPTADTRPRTRTQLNVHLGPGQAFAIVGVLPRAEPVEVVGRDAGAGWVAVRFPPGSPGRGWVPVSDLDGLTGLYALSVVLPTPLASSVTIPSSRISTPISGDDGIVITNPTNSPVPGTSILPGIGVTTTPSPPSGPPDLVVNRLTLLSDGRVLVVVGNRGQGPVTGQSIFVQVRDHATRSEVLTSLVRELPVGATVAFETVNLVIDSETDITAIVDPYSSLPDPNRGNNTLSATLTPPPAPTAVPAP